jgi:hypothetical protein
VIDIPELARLLIDIPVLARLLIHALQHRPESEELAIAQVQVVQRYKYRLANDLPDVAAGLRHAGCCLCTPLAAKTSQQQRKETACTAAWGAEGGGGQW